MKTLNYLALAASLALAAPSYAAERSGWTTSWLSLIHI